jgi:hypothetical protein
MEIGKVLNYDGRTYVLLGMEPMSVPDRRADLEDTETGEVLMVPCSLLAQCSQGFERTTLS